MINVLAGFECLFIKFSLGFFSVFLGGFLDVIEIIFSKEAVGCVRIVTAVNKRWRC